MKDQVTARKTSETFTCGIDAAMAYLKADRNSSTVAAGGHGDHVPVSVELGRNCSGSETENYESGGESEDACTIANHGDPRSKVRTISEAPATGDTGASNSGVSP